jgi:hypothetical protein
MILCSSREINIKKNLPGLQFIIAGRMSLVMLTNSNGRTIPFITCQMKTALDPFFPHQKGPIGQKTISRYCSFKPLRGKRSREVSSPEYPKVAHCHRFRLISQHHVIL